MLCLNEIARYRVAYTRRGSSMSWVSRWYSYRGRSGARCRARAARVRLINPALWLAYLSVDPFLTKWSPSNLYAGTCLPLTLGRTIAIVSTRRGSTKKLSRRVAIGSQRILEIPRTPSGKLLVPRAGTPRKRERSELFIAEFDSDIFNPGDRLFRKAAYISEDSAWFIGRSLFHEWVSMPRPLLAT